MLALAAPAAWRLPDAYAAADLLLKRNDRRKARGELLKLLHSQSPELRKRAADVARRITEKDRSFLEPAADEIAGILSEVPVGENRTRWHLGLVVARTARTPAQVAFASELMWLLSEDASNVVQCSAVEGMGELALRSRAVREQAAQYLFRALDAGTVAMKCRARHALTKLGMEF